MLTKLFFTMLVIILVGVFFKNRNKTSTPEQKPPLKGVSSSPHSEEQSSLKPKTVAYLLIVLLLIISGAVAYFSWTDAHQLVRLRVFNAKGDLSEYHAYRKDIRERNFTSIKGIHITLAETDRLEMQDTP